MLSKEIIDRYNAVRNTDNKTVICHAPFTNLNFEQNGNVTACCFNRKEVLGKYPAQTISQIWKGAALKTLRKKIGQNDLSGGCKLCGVLLETENYHGSKAIYYDENAQKSPNSWEKFKNTLGIEPDYFPKVFEFEISNTCNLACEMCNGYFSSTIRQRREMLPPLANPYDDVFVDQVADFMPHLTDMKFLGGEPFLIELYLKIWERVNAINPGIRVHITTNGSVFNQRIESLLEKLNAGFIFSIDSIDPGRYEQIRKGATFARVMENFYRFKEIATRKNTYLSVTACVMSTNWSDLPGIVRFANKESVAVHFNIVWNPGHLSIRFMQHDEIEDIINYLIAQEPSAENEREKSNLNNYHEVISTLQYWKKERSYTRLVEEIDEKYIFNINALSSIPEDKLSRKIAHELLFHFFKAKRDPAKLTDLALFFGDQVSEKSDISKLLLAHWGDVGDTLFANTLLDLYVPLYRTLLGDEGLDDFLVKMEAGKPVMLNFKHLQALLSDMIEGIARRGILHQLLLVKNNTPHAHQKHLEESY